MKSLKPVLVIHGGAGQGAKNPARAAVIREKIARILDIATLSLLEKGALEAVVQAVRLLENDPAFNAGTGANLQGDGHARLSASVMDGARERFGAVVNLEGFLNPVAVARALLEKDHRVLAGEGAAAFAREIGAAEGDVRTPESIKRWKARQGKGSDTVGACALDSKGRLAAATSTGGIGSERPGRVSDSAMPASTFATESCAVSSSGTGEEIIEEGLAVKIATRVRDGQAIARAFDLSLKEAAKRGKRMGAIGVDARGRVAWGKTTPSFVYGWRQERKVVLF